MELAILALKIAICAYVITGPLMEYGNFLYWYGSLLGRLEDAKFEWLAKPLGRCGKCFAGQVAFWWYLLYHTQNTGYYWFNHIFFTLLTILFEILIELWIQKQQR